jgi:steroid delta-isomerase-like uncharacterized protein
VPAAYKEEDEPTIDESEVTIMSVKANRSAARRFLEDIWSKGDMQAVDELLTPDFAFVLSFMRTDGTDEFKNLVHANRTAFENLTYSTTEEDIVAEEGKAAAYWTMSAKHVGTWAGIEATGKEVSIEGMSFLRFRGDKISEARVQNDVRGLRRQLGVSD